MSSQPTDPTVTPFNVNTGGQTNVSAGNITGSQGNIAIGSYINQTSVQSATQDILFSLPPTVVGQLTSLVSSGMVGKDANEVVAKAINVLAIAANEYASDPTAELVLLTKGGNYIRRFINIIQRRTSGS